MLVAVIIPALAALCDSRESVLLLGHVTVCGGKRSRAEARVVRPPACNRRRALNMRVHAKHIGTVDASIRRRGGGGGGGAGAGGAAVC